VSTARAASAHGAVVRARIASPRTPSQQYVYEEAR
jgi:hypothetical protein